MVCVFPICGAVETGWNHCRVFAQEHNTFIGVRERRMIRPDAPGAVANDAVNIFVLSHRYMRDVCTVLS